MNHRIRFLIKKCIGTIFNLQDKPNIYTFFTLTFHSCRDGSPVCNLYINLDMLVFPSTFYNLRDNNFIFQNLPIDFDLQTTG